MKVLPESWRRCLSEEQRQEIGQPTIAESKAKGAARLERDLQRQIVQDLRRRGFEVCWHATHRKSTATKDWPDLTWSHYGRSIAWEIKLPGKNPRPGQEIMLALMRNKPNNWTVAVVRSFDEYLAELHKLYVGNPDATRPAT